MYLDVYAYINQTFVLGTVEQYYCRLPSEMKDWAFCIHVDIVYARETMVEKHRAYLEKPTLRPQTEPSTTEDER